MINIKDLPSGFRDAEWLLFFGWVSNRDRYHVELKPAEDTEITVTMATQDVYDFPSEPEIASVEGRPITPVFVRRFARAANIEWTAASQFQAREVAASNRVNPSCSATGSRCIGNLEFCCPNFVAVGACYGRWRCD